MTTISNRLIYSFSIGFILAAVLVAWLIVDVHAEDRAKITQLTQDLPKCHAISDALFGQDSRIESHGLISETTYSFCDEDGRNCKPTYVLGARG